MGELLIIHKIIILSNEVLSLTQVGNILDSPTDNFLESWQVSKFAVLPGNRCFGKDCILWEWAQAWAMLKSELLLKILPKDTEK